MTEPILSHTYPNGLVLVAEPIACAAIGGLHLSGARPAAFTIRRARRAEQFHLRDGAPRGRPARQPPVHSRSGQPRRRAERRRSPAPTPATAGPRWPRTCRRRWPSTPTCCGGPHLPEDQLEAGRLAMLQELRAVEDEPAQKVMIELRRRHYPEPWGRPVSGRAGGAGSDDHRRHPRASSAAAIGPTARSSAWPAASIGSGLADLVGELLGDWRAGGRRSDRRRRRPPAATSTCPTIRSRRRSASPTPACLIAIPTTFRPGARSACSAAA